ncbi:hypothetical protein P7C70_g6289, partial [Phenoliferia sp. Uapishka_3]
MSRRESAFERVERLQLESAIALSLPPQLPSPAAVHPFPTLHGTLDNSSYPNNSFSDHADTPKTTTTDSISDFPTLPTGREQQQFRGKVGQAEAIGTPFSDIKSFSDERNMKDARRDGRKENQAGRDAGGESDGEGDDSVILNDSEDERDNRLLSTSTNNNSSSSHASNALLSISNIPSQPQPPTYDWSDPPTTSSAFVPAIPPPPIPVQVLPAALSPTNKKRERDNDFSIVVNNPKKSSKKEREKDTEKLKVKLKIPETKKAAALSKEFIIDSDEDDEVVPPPARVAKRPKIVDDEEEIEMGSPLTD